jgi:predicted Zn-dependent protease
MSNQENTRATGERSSRSKQNGNQDPRPQEVIELLDKVSATLDAGHPQKALELLHRSKVKSPWLTNATAVCLLRLGDTNRAIEMLKGLAVTSGVCFRTDVPAVFLTNYATALLMAHNVSGSSSALSNVRDEENPSVQRLRGAIRKWKAGLSLWQKIRWYWGDTPGSPMELGFPPGEI